MTGPAAEILAIKALGYLANSEGTIDRFLAQSGMSIQNLRERAGDSELLAAVMDFLLADDALLTDFCESESLEPKTLHLARHALPGG